MRYNKQYSSKEEELSASFDEGKPDRERIISEDEILNLTILLNTETDFEKLLSQL